MSGKKKTGTSTYKHLHETYAYNLKHEFVRFFYIHLAIHPR